MKSHEPFFFPELTEEQLGLVSLKEISIETQTFKVLQPAAPDALLDQASIHAAYEKDEYMPYWASLWPVAVFLAEEILARSFAPNLKTIEIACGLGLAGMAAAKKRLDVLFTDYDANAVKFAKKNCALNDIQNASFALLDIRSPIEQTFDLIIVSDLIYERRNVEPLVSLLERMLAKNGIALVSDQGRPYQENFLALLRVKGFQWTTVQKKLVNPEGKEITGFIFTISRNA
jgi:predicted nicotinamide N-methyase